MYKKITPHIIALVVLFVSLFLLYAPYFTQGKVLNQADNVRAHAMQAEMNKFEKETGKTPLWTQSMFSGMPTYQIRPPDKGNYTRYALKALMFNQSISFVPVLIFMAMFCTYLFLIALGVDWRLSIIGSICYGFSTFYCDIADAGHSTKMLALALLPGVFTGALLTLRGRYLLGGALFGLFLSLQILVNHIQITYYGLLIPGILCLIKLWHAIKTKQLRAISFSFLALVVAGLLALAANTSRLWSTLEYSKETIRGKSELASKSAKGAGLTEDYAFSWSYSLLETMTLIVPNFYGGGASQTFKGTETYDRLFNSAVSDMTQRGYSNDAARRNAEQQIGSMFYWGEQPFVGVAIYFGVVICFLFVLGAFLIKSPYKIWLLAGGLVALMFAWGNHFFVNSILFDYFPMFNKFRAVSMALGISQFFFIILAIWALQELMDPAISFEKKKKSLIYATGIIGGLCLIALFAGFSMNFSGKNDERIGAEIASMVKLDRASLLKADAIRSILLVLLSAAGVWMFIKGKLRSNIAIMGIGILAILDIWLVDKRILYPDKFESPSVKEAEAIPDKVDEQILADKDPLYRVLDLRRGDPFTNANTSFFHKSLGGYHAAKLMLYQDVIEKYLSNPGQHMNILNMLNTKYVMQGEGEKEQMFPTNAALGNAWFVKNYTFAPNADAELEGLDKLDTKTTAIVRESDKGKLAKLSTSPDTSASIKLSAYNPDKMEYKYKSGTDQLAVFSEIYYPPAKGWKMKLDGKPFDDFIKVNYLLRGLVVPAGEHTLEMSFEPKSFYSGETISMGASGILMLLAILGLLWHFWKNGFPEVMQLHEIPVTNEKPNKPKHIHKKK